MIDALTVTRIIKAPPKSVFEAWTNPELLVKWWGPGPVTCPEAEVDLREGGAYRIANRELDGSITWISGEFTKVSPPDRLEYTWEVNIVPDMLTLVTVDFNAHPDGTELVITHDRFPNSDIRDMHGEGWGGCLDKLDALFAQS
jgi:uncharacterized protein YndB with AHSA1/START domain